MKDGVENDREQERKEEGGWEGGRENEGKLCFSSTRRWAGVSK